MSEATPRTPAETDQRPRDWMKRSQIEGLAALIVGGGSGMGAACARAFAANDGLVIVADLNLENAERVASEIRESGGKAVPQRLDVSKRADIDTAVQKTMATYGRLDVLINSATWSA